MYFSTETISKIVTNGANITMSIKYDVSSIYRLTNINIITKENAVNSLIDRAFDFGSICWYSRSIEPQLGFFSSLFGIIIKLIRMSNIFNQC